MITQLRNEVYTMLLTIPEVASKLHVSKQSIYSKIKLTEYKNKIVMKHGITMCDDDLVKLIQDNLKVTTRFIKVEQQQATSEAETAQDAIPDEDTVRINQDLVKALLAQLKEKDLQLHEQLTAKDIQINNLTESLKQAHKLIENNQILLKDKPQQNILLLEEHFQDLDIKLEEVKENMQQRKDHEKSKGFFSKIFRGTSED